MRFSEIIGHPLIIKRLIASVHDNRVAHAQLFLGPEGAGALPLALAYAQYVNCENRQENDSCGECNSCNKTSKYIHSDLHFTFPTIAPHKQSRELMKEWRTSLEANPYMSYKDWILEIGKENKQGNITAEEIRDILKRLSLKQLEGEYKVQIIWGAEYLGKEGNMLLKILEEPAEKTLFILVGEDSEKILPTILSRTQVVRIPHITEADMKAALQERMDVPESQAMQLAALAGGNWNRALQLVNEAGSDYLDVLKTFLNQSLTRKDVAGLFRTIDGIAQTGREQVKMFLDYFLIVIRKSWYLKISGIEQPGLDEAENDFIRKMSGRIEPARTEELVERISKSAAYVERNANAKIVMFNLSLSVRKNLK